MKTNALILALLLSLLPSLSQAQSSVEAPFVRGTWKLVLDVASKDADTPSERVVSKTLSALLDEIDIRFEFMEENRLKVISSAFGEAEVDSSEWHINEQGELLLGKTDVLDAEDTVWLREGKRLVAYRRGEDGELERQERLYLERLK